MAEGFVGEALRPGGEVERFEGNPPGKPSPPKGIEDRLEVVVPRPAVFSVELVDVDVSNVVEVAVDEDGVRLRLVDGVVNVEHRADGWAVDLAHDRDGFLQTEDDVGLVRGKRFDEHGDVPRGRVRRNSGEPIDEIPG